MAHIIYSDTPETQRGIPINISKINPSKPWLKHYENFRYLTFIHNNTSDGYEKRQANKEIQVAIKKMEWWWKLAKWGHVTEIQDGIKEVNKRWNILTSTSVNAKGSVDG